MESVSNLAYGEVVTCGHVAQELGVAQPRAVGKAINSKYESGGIFSR